MSIALPLGSSLAIPSHADEKVAPSRADLLNLLVEQAKSPQSFIGIHAAEFLVDLNSSEEILTSFRDRADDNTPEHRVTVWRILARIETPEKRTACIERIRKALLDPAGPDRVHALEALAKLSASIEPAERELVTEWAGRANDNAAPFAQWRLAVVDRSSAAVTQLELGLKNDDEVTRLRSAYILWKMKPIGHNAVASVLTQEPADSKVRPFLVAAAGKQADLFDLARSDNASARACAATELASGLKSDAIINQLTTLVHDEDVDVRVCAAYALLKLAP